MKWSRRSPHSIASSEYIISSAKVQGKDIFTLWCGTEVVGYARTAAMAKQMAEDTAREKRA